jgi:lambda family phage tail tape measure protein
MAMNMDAMLRIKADVQGENNIRRLGNSMQGLQGQAKNAALGFNSLKGAVAGFGAAIAGSALVAGLSAVVKKSIDAGDELFNLQAKTGVAANALIGIGNAAKLADVDVGTLGKGLTKLNVNLVKAAEGNEDLGRKFQALGVNVKDANGQVVPADKALKQIADRFADMPDGAQKAAAAVALFGKSGADLIPLLNEGAASMEEFTFKIGEDFAARSDIFNDTLTEFGIKTQGFGLELTDALLPALQSILEVFGELFNTETDWTDLFNVIKFGISGLAAVLLAMVKLVDEAVRLIGSFAKRAALAFKGDFAGATAEADRFGADFMKRFQANMGQFQRLFTDAPSPGTGRRTRGRNLELDTSTADAKAATEAKRRAAEAKRAAAEQERLEDRRATLTQKAIGLQDQLRNSIADVVAAYEGVGATPTEQLFLDRNEAITENDRQVKALTLSVVELAREVNAAGGSLDVKPFADLIDRLSAANVALADKEYQQGFSDYWLSQADAIKEATAAAWEFARAQQYNADIIGGLRDGIGSYVESVGTMREATAQLAQTGIKGVEDAIFSLMTTGTANFKEFAAEILKQTARMIIQQLILKTIMQALGAIGGGGGGGLGGIGASTQFNASGVNFNPAAFSGPKLFANGGIMTGDGPVPLKKYASGGIANSPQLALYGEGSKPEAYVPLPDGRRIPVAMQGGGGGGNTSVVVNVDASGNSNVQGDQGQAKQLGVVVSAAVQAELVKQQRPGGLLAGTRR